MITSVDVPSQQEKRKKDFPEDEGLKGKERDGETVEQVSAIDETAENEGIFDGRVVQHILSVEVVQ